MLGGIHGCVRAARRFAQIIVEQLDVVPREFGTNNEHRQHKDFDSKPSAVAFFLAFLVGLLGLGYGPSEVRHGGWGLDYPPTHRGCRGNRWNALDASR